MASALDDFAQDHRLSPRQWQVARHILDCRTEALGGFALRCDQCDEETPLFHACRDRHCPRCQRHASQACAHASRLRCYR